MKSTRDMPKEAEQTAGMPSPKYQRRMTMDPSTNSHHFPHAVQTRRASMGGPPPSYYSMYSRPPSYMPQVSYSPIPLRPTTSPLSSGPIPHNYRRYESNYAMHPPIARRGTLMGSIMPSYDARRSSHPANLDVPMLSTAKEDDSSATLDSNDAADLEKDEKPKKKKRAPSSNSFPAKLHKILSDPANHDYIAWLPHGRAWRILKPKGFEEDIVPKYFRSERYASFMRQVNGWGFKRITEGPDLNAYYHEMFLRGLPEICRKMRRGKEPMKDLGECPDFYKISMFAPLPDPDGDIPFSTAVVSKEPEETRDDKSSKILRSASSSSVSSLSESPRTTKSNMSKEFPSAAAAAAASERTKALTSKALPPLRTPPPSPVATKSMYESEIAKTPPFPRTPSFADIGDSEFASCTGSLGSWGADQDELMWGRSAFSPGNQVTPPGPALFPMSGVPGVPALPMAETRRDSDNGLSVADLCYLTQQNRILLEQAYVLRTPDSSSSQK